MKSGDNIVKNLYLDEYRLGEWLQVVSTVFQHSRSSSLTEVDYYERQPEKNEDFALKLKFTSKKGIIEKAIAGPNLTEALLNQLVQVLKKHLPANRKQKVMRYILFSM